MDTRDMLNLQIEGFANVQRRADEIAKDRGHELTDKEMLLIHQCSHCEDECTCHE